MKPSTPFVDRQSGRFDVEQILDEAVPVAKLIGLFASIALVPLVFEVLTRGVIGGLMRMVAWYIIAVGSALTLMYVIVRASQLSEEQAPPTASAGQANAGGSTDPTETADEDDAAAGDSSDAAVSTDVEGATADERGAGSDAGVDDGDDTGDGSGGSGDASDDDGQSGEDGDATDE